VIGSAGDGDGHRTRNRAEERHRHQPAHPVLSGVTKQHHTDGAGHHCLTDDEGSSGTVHRTELQRHSKQVEAAEPSDSDRPGGGVGQQNV
jgi:hypothetical protein